MAKKGKMKTLVRLSGIFFLAGYAFCLFFFKSEQCDLWIYAKYIVSNDGILKNKYLGITGNGKIGAISDQKPDHGVIIDAGNHILSPGFINAHDHLSYNHRGPLKETLPSYVEEYPERFNHRYDWSRGCREYQRFSTPKTKRAEFLIWNELRQVVAGTTSNIGAGGYFGFLRNFGSYFPHEGVKLKKKIWSDTFPLKGKTCKFLLEDGDQYPFHPSNRDDSIYIVHISEGKDAAARNEFINISSDEGKRRNILGKNIGLTHSIALLEEDIRKIAVSGATVVWSPRSNLALYGVTAPVSLMKDYGINLALGTDWAYSGSAHILDELKVASQYNEKYLNNVFSNKELWQMVTVNPARLLALDDQIGDIKVGMLADIVLFFAGNKEFETDEDIYGAVIGMDTSKTALVMRSGTVLYGKWKLLKGIIAENKQDTDIFFNEEYYIATSAETGYTYRQLRTVNEKYHTYPLFPAPDPSATPVMYPVSLKNRLYPEASVYSGEITSSDPDGDGIMQDDNDERYFNPVRPVDLTDNNKRQTRARRLKN